ncbi:unnamed protein product [Symbiodinium natans]|uniref:Beta-lactamase-related domain-containing protein n=1 Tax=Symbiodinium natans TaxID=878477 RepID=A0A812S5T9_9DINO|nr:unnamed protein product [Symbiodinium natans]
MSFGAESSVLLSPQQAPDAPCNTAIRSMKHIDATFAAPEEVGIDPSRLERLTHVLRDLVRSGPLPNAAMLVARKGKVSFVDFVGEARPGKVVDGSTIWRVYSMAKPITSVAMLMLIEEGRALLTDPIHRFLGQRWHRENLQVRASDGSLEPCQHDITIRHLLTHTAGLYYGPVYDSASQPDYPDIDSETNLETFVDKLPQFPLAFQPGSQWKYSYATDVVGRVVEVLSGMDLETFFQERIFRPLRMVDTSFYVQTEKLSRFVDCWQQVREGERKNVTAEQMRRREFQPGVLLSGGGGLVSTLSDYHRFCMFLLNGGSLDGHRLLSRKAVEWMTMNHLPGNKDMVSLSTAGYTETAIPGVGFGLGVAVHTDPVASGQIYSQGSFSWGGSANTYFLCDPVEDISFVFMTQLVGLDRARHPIRTMLPQVLYSAVADGPLKCQVSCHSSL